MVKAVLPSSAAGITSGPACFATGRSSTAGVNSITAYPGGSSSGQSGEAGAVGRQADARERVPKKGVTEQPQPVPKKREIVACFKHLISNIRRGCQLMNIARSTFYYKGKTRSSYQVKAEADLRDRIEAICLEFPRYGYRQVTHQLKRERWQVNHKKVLRLMRESDVLCRVKRRWVKTTDSKHRFAA